MSFSMPLTQRLEYGNARKTVPILNQPLVFIHAGPQPEQQFPQHCPDAGTETPYGDGGFR